MDFGGDGGVGGDFLFGGEGGGWGGQHGCGDGGAASAFAARGCGSGGWLVVVVVVTDLVDDGPHDAVVFLSVFALFLQRGFDFAVLALQLRDGH